MPLLAAAIERDLADLRSRGRTGGAVALREASGMHFNATSRPQYFTGDLAARFVLVHLNPKQTDDTADESVDDMPFGTVEEYLDWYTTFGARHYGAASPRAHRSPFDLKQIRFIRPFGDVAFVPDEHPDAHWVNLERVIDAKLQLELIPYGSDTFSAAPLVRDPRLLRPHMERLLETIAAWPRSHVVFCGAVFDRVLRDFKVGPTQQFRLSKKDGSLTKGTYRFAPLVLEHQGKPIPAAIAHSFSAQGLPAEEYGREIANRYASMRV